MISSEHQVNLPESNPDLMICDSHVHAFPSEVIENRADYCRLDEWCNLLYGNPKARLITAEQLIESMDRAQITHSVLCGFPWRDQGLCRLHNDYMADAAAASNGRLSWLGIVSPEQPGMTAEARRCLELGAAGIGEMNADAQGFDFNEPVAFFDLDEICREYDVPTMFHVSEPVGHLYPGKGTGTPEKFVTFLEAYPDLSVIAAHWGGGLPFYELMPEVRKIAENVVYDSAASTFLYDFSIFNRVVDLVGADRILFGSDYPVLRQKRFRERVDSVDLTPADRAAIMGGTARRLFKLDGVAARDD